MSLLSLTQRSIVLSRPRVRTILTASRRVLSQPNTEHTTKAVGAPPEPVMGAGALQDFALSDPFLTPSVVTARMYRDLVTGVAKAHLPEAAPLHFPDGYFGRLNAFQSEFGLKFNQNELLLRALTHRSHAINWLEPRESKREGWWRSPAAVATVQKYDQVINVVSNASMASLGLSLMFFLTQSYLFQKHPTLSSSALARESRALCAAPLLASLGSAHFLLTTNKLVLCDARGLTEEGQEQMLRDTTCALIAAVYLDAGIAGVSEFAAQQVFPALIKLRENIELVQPESHLERLNTVLKSAHLLPYFRTKQVLNEGTTNTEYIVALSVGGIEMATGRGTNTAAARNNAAAVAMQNPSLVALLPAVAKTIVTEHLNKIGAPPSKVLSKALHIESQTAQPSALTGKPQL